MKKIKLTKEEYNDVVNHNITLFQYERHQKRFGKFTSFGGGIDLKRQKGNSTRLIDQYIQELFTKGAIKVRDHIDTRECHSVLFDRIYKRLMSEHRHELENLNVNKHLLTIHFRNL